MKRGFLDLLDPSNDPEFFWQVISGPPCIIAILVVPCFLKSQIRNKDKTVNKHETNCQRQKTRNKKSIPDTKLKYSFCIFKNKLGCLRYRTNEKYFCSKIQDVPELADQTYRAFSLVITESNSV
jgi:hypothetical protein